MAGPLPSTMTSIATSPYFMSSRTCSAEAWLGGSMIMSPNNAGNTLNSDRIFVLSFLWTGALTDRVPEFSPSPYLPLLTSGFGKAPCSPNAGVVYPRKPCVRSKEPAPAFQIGAAQQVRHLDGQSARARICSLAYSPPRGPGGEPPSQLDRDRRENEQPFPLSGHT